MLVCGGASVCMRACALGIVYWDKILRFKNNLIIIYYHTRASQRIPETTPNSNIAVIFTAIIITILL